MAGSSEKLWHSLSREVSCRSLLSRSYSSKFDLRKLRPMIQKRIENRAKDYPIPSMVPVAEEVLKAKGLLIQGVSMLLKVFPVVTCKFCSEVFIGEKGHLIKTCHGYRRRGKDRVHEWMPGGLNDILVPVEAFHLHHMFQGVIKHQGRFDYDRVPAVVELCWQAGATQHWDVLHSQTCNVENTPQDAESLSGDNLRFIASGTLRAWETVRDGVTKLLMAYPAKVCKYCSEVHIGPSGHKARLCGVFKYESWRGTHFWKKAGVDDLVRPRIVWRRRPHDPPVLLDECRDYYGHAPAVVDLCTKARVAAPTKYHCMMKVQGLSAPVGTSIDHLVQTGS